MKHKKFCRAIFTAIFLLLVFTRIEAQITQSNVNWTPNLNTSLGAPIVWDLWPSEAPGNAEELPPEYDTTKPDGDLVAGRRVARITNVSVPQLAIYKPDTAKDTRTAVIIAPGGGYWILAYDLEGTEVAEWLNSLGVTAIILKYRVPGQHWNKEKRWLSAAQDGQRAVSLVRSRAGEIGVDPDKIGIMGFSAGGTPVLHTSLVSERHYDAVDDVDKVSFHPNFAAPIYSVGPPENADYGDDCPPFFMLVTNDDFGPLGMANMYIALKKANKSAELHIYESGGHGYGLRKTDDPVTSWPDRMEEWMRKLGFLDR